ncbi:RNA-binding protein NOB1 [Diachasma alloeum]|uniref:RNA-binding protein NOB1 n=1 Tax=Diachasma alloeum TaxID=454923 RepID=UPI0007382BF6|nr:RNA-binding protein NOB1 [Diachasma alloeum]
MNFERRVEHVIVDTSAFIKNVPLQEVGENIITEQSVINEIKSKRQLRRLVVLPYDLVIKDVFPENIQFVTEFAKKTGDYTSLSATDIKVIALTYQLEKEKVGTDHLKESPAIVKTLPATRAEPLAHPKSIIGFYVPGDDENEGEDSEDDGEGDETLTNPEVVKNLQNSEGKPEPVDNTQQEESEILEGRTSQSPDSDVDGTDEESEGYLTAQSDQDSQTEKTDLISKFERLNCNADEFELETGAENADEILAPVGKESSEEEEEESTESEEDDDEGWITPSNVAQAKKEMESDIISDKPAKVACMTTDFAMQNVLMQIGLNVAALDGRVIRQMRTFIFRCYACFKTTSIMTKVFCPNCGLKTLKKVAVSLDDQGNEKIHINFRKPLSARGKRFSLPTPKGGKHANNPILCEDQPVPDQRPSRLARMKNDPLNDDYIAGYSPFIMRDVNSKSAMLGIRAGHSNFKYWMKKNPNESRKKRK